MSRPDPNTTLARHHHRHASPFAGCPVCMRAPQRETLPRWTQPRVGR
jgi:hypothetical protein